MDRSLIFFYSFIGLIFTIFFIQLIRDPHRGPGLWWLASLIASMFISALFFSVGEGVWFISSLTLSIIVPAAIMLTLYRVRRGATKKMLIQTVESIRQEGIACLADQLARSDFREWRKKEWYAINSPLNNTFEIGLNPWRLTPVVDETFHIFVLSGRTFAFKPDYIAPMPNINCEMVCRLTDFYAFSEESQKRVTDYIDAIQNNAAEPWKIIPTEQDEKEQL